MNQRHTIALLTLLTVFFFVPASAQTKKPAVKKQQAKTTAKPVSKAKTPAKSTTVQKAGAKNLGDAASKVAADTTKKGGQNNPNDNNSSLAEEIVVTTSYKPVLAEAVKIRRNPDLEDKTPYKAPLNYVPLDKKLSQDNNIRQLDAMKRPQEQDSIQTNNYAKVGIGSMKTTFGEAYFGNGKDQALQVGGYLKHFAQSGSSLDKQNDSRQEVGVFGKSIGAENTLTGRITYKRHQTYFYGIDQDNPPVAFEPAKQVFNTIGAEGEIAKNFKDVENAFTYAAKFKGYVFNNAFSAKESNVVISGFLNKTVKQFYAGLSASLDLGSQKDVLYSQNNSIVRANPYIKFQGENYKIDVGVNIAKEFGFSDRFFIFPAAKLEFQVVPKYVRLFAEAKGDVNRASIKDLTDVNPFLGENINLANSVDKLDITVGLKGTLAPGLGFKAAIYRNSIKNLPLFVNNFATTFNKYQVIYDNGDARVSGFNGELDFKASEDVNVYGRVEFKDYKMASEAQPWNLPKFILTAGTSIHINDKVDINGSLMFRGSTQDPLLVTGSTPAAPQYTQINSFADISGGATYKINKQLSVFVQANNILNASSKTWVYYPNYGFNIFGGVGYAF
ncbi:MULTISPECIES: TonB-dependent receptor [unclassified Mucilaginibacter]|uniref:TonB-dependent receptor n=2 Tax=Mucilaginibacter TaxID=423349 RepID=UPI002AC8FEC6|nr:MULTISPECIES: TonB-dependent receptor [unclassified Mucilaginibacter]MEB0278014.1 TonB-dependent receptor [Mucilaginibacter sp. 10B2]MEB0299633.1 TonB-dependent receptor [Mucilaginibacter sp. 5C4]WPX22903.1 TonB-dependent receptor [Mucilaginibacter sp. 5C4]